MKVGELITVDGQLSRIDDLPRLKTKSAEQIVPTGQVFELNGSDILSPNDLDEDFLGGYFTVKGIVVKKSGKSIYLANEVEEEHNVRVYTKFSTKDLGIKKGSQVIVAGILSETDSGFKLQPFTIADISVSREVLGEKIEGEKNNVDVVTTTNQIVEISQKNHIKNIIIFIAIGLMLAMIAYFFKKKKTLTF